LFLLRHGGKLTRFQTPSVLKYAAVFRHIQS
jgi:hypothetical protein